MSAALRNQKPNPSIWGLFESDRLPGLDLLRSIAIIWVMLFHSFLLGGLGPNWSWLSRFGWMGVDLFFVLSGFLIGTQVLTPLAHGQRLSYGDFYLRRAFRILPAYWAVLLLYSVWPAFREAPGMEPSWKFLTFFVNLSIDYGRNTAFSHAWSLCVEEHFYWLFPVLAVALFRRPAVWKFASLCVVLVLGGIALRAAIWNHGMDSDPTLTRNWFIEDIYYPSWSRLDGLLCGVALATWKTLRPQSWQRARRYSNLCLLAAVPVFPCFRSWLARVRWRGARQFHWPLGVSTCWLGCGHLLQPVPHAQSHLPLGARVLGPTAGRRRDPRVLGLRNHSSFGWGRTSLRGGAPISPASQALGINTAPATLGQPCIGFM